MLLDSVAMLLDSVAIEFLRRSKNLFENSKNVNSMLIFETKIVFYFILRRLELLKQILF